MPDGFDARRSRAKTAIPQNRLSTGRDHYRDRVKQSEGSPRWLSQMQPVERHRIEVGQIQRRLALGGHKFQRRGVAEVMYQ